MQVLVTGGTGFIGIHLVAALVARGWRVRCLVRETSNRRPLSAHAIEYVVGSLQDQTALHQAVQGAELIFHLAGATKVRVPDDYDRINYGGTQKLLEACADAGTTLRKFIYTSSIAAAGPSPSGAAVKESDPAHPVGPYGRSKLRAEQAILALKAQLPVIILRPSAIYGPYDTDFLRLFRAVKRGLLPYIGGQELHIDVCYVDDLIRGMLAAAECRNDSGEVFFLGGDCYTWGQLGAEIARHVGTRPRAIRLPRSLVLAAASVADGWARLSARPSVLSRANLLERLQPYWVYDSSKAREAFGYVPEVTLAQGIAQTLRWYRDVQWL